MDFIAGNAEAFTITATLVVVAASWGSYHGVRRLLDLIISDEGKTP